MADKKKSKNPGTSILKQRQKGALAVLLILSVIAIAVGGTMAAYTHQSYVKGVAATNESEILFLSDNLHRCLINTASTDFTTQKLITSSSNDTVSISFYIRNYIGSRVNENAVTYNLKIIPSYEPDAQHPYQLTGSELASGVNIPSSGCNLEFTMAAETQIQHSFVITLPRTAMDHFVNFTVTAEPVSGSVNATSGYMLAAVLEPSVTGSTAQTSCVGTFADKSSNAPYELDAFNYAVTVSNTSEQINVTLSWNPECVEIDPFFLSDHELTVQDNVGTKSVTFLSGNESYLIQFYRKVSPENTGWQASWNAMEAANIISVSN